MEAAMSTTSPANREMQSELPLARPASVSPQEWEAARQSMLAKEKAHMRAHDALAAKRRRMPWMLVEKAYEFEGSHGKLSLLDLFEGRRQLIVYRAFFEPAFTGGPTMPAWAARSAPIRSPTWRTSTPATRPWSMLPAPRNVISRGDEAMGTVWSYLDMTALGRQEDWENSPEGYPKSKPDKWWNWHDSYDRDVPPDPKWDEVSDAGVAASPKKGEPQ
jgi:predicted dithiol-disulfide oxidoreductase (DUF899 family)